MATFEVSASFQQLQHLNIPQLPTTPQHTYHQIESLANLKTESKTQFYRHKARLHDPQTVKEHSLIKLKNPQKRIMLIGGDISARIMACSCCYCMPCSQQLGEQYVLFYISYKYKICWFIWWPRLKANFKANRFELGTEFVFYNFNRTLNQTSWQKNSLT